MRKWWHVLVAASALLDGALALMVVGLHYGEDAWTDRGPRRTPRPTTSWTPPCLPTLASLPSHESAKQKLKKAGRRTAEEQEETGEKTETTGEGDD